MNHLKNALATLILALLAAIYWFFTQSNADKETSFLNNLESIGKVTIVFFLIFFIIYFGYSFVIRASRQNNSSDED